jgi:hypothetical protein
MDGIVKGELGMKRAIIAMAAALVVGGCWETAIRATSGIPGPNWRNSAEYKSDYRSPYDQSAMTDEKICRGVSYGNPAHEEEATKRKLECK